MLAARRLVTFLNAFVQGIDKGIRTGAGGSEVKRAVQDVISPYVRQSDGQVLTVLERKAVPVAAQFWHEDDDDRLRRLRPIGGLQGRPGIRRDPRVFPQYALDLQRRDRNMAARRSRSSWARCRSSWSVHSRRTTRATPKP